MQIHRKGFEERVIGPGRGGNVIYLFIEVVRIRRSDIGAGVDEKRKRRLMLDVKELLREAL